MRARERPAEIRHCPACVEYNRLVLVHVVQQEASFAEPCERPLHALLVGKLPEHAGGGRIIVRRIAGLTGYANYTVYRWLQNDRLTPRAAGTLIGTFAGRITKEDLVPFVFG